MSIFDDIKADIEASLSRKNMAEAERKVLDRMDEIKNRETLQGKSPAKGGRWNNLYDRDYAKREKGGRRSPVTMRRSAKDIEQTEIQSSSKRSTLSFRDGKKGQIFYLHNEGEARGGKFRQIFPNNDSQVPKELDKIAEKAVWEALNE